MQDEEYEEQATQDDDKVEQTDNLPTDEDGPQDVPQAPYEAEDTEDEDDTDIEPGEAQDGV